MNEIAFAIHLGGGLYMDSSGILHQLQPPNVPVYDAPFQLPIDPKKVGNALNDVKKSLKEFAEDKAVIDKFAKWGFDPKLLILLSFVSKVAGIIAPILFVLSFAIDIATLFGWLKKGPDAFEELVKQRFEELETHVDAIATLIQTKDLRNGRDNIVLFSAGIDNYVKQLNNLNPSIDQLEADKTRLFDLYNTNVAGIFNLLDVSTWMGIFARSQYTRVWPWMEGVLYTQPGGPYDQPMAALQPADGTPNFDHRLMFPLASLASLTFLTCIRGISPEYRTTGDFRHELKDIASKLDLLAQTMRERVLARTIYKPEHFSQPLGVMDWEVIDFPPYLSEEEIKISPQCSRWPVGAMDLRYHDDTFFNGFLGDLAKSEHFGWSHQTKHGGMDFRWAPPARLQRSPDIVTGGWRYTITNPEECAAAANAQSEKDYADLLAMSGYIELLLLATLFRSESTEPDESQTVSVKSPVLSRNPQTSSQVVVKSNDILMTGIITSVATRAPQECAGRVDVRTQPIKRAQPLEYTIKLRTLASIVSEKRWREPAYSSYQWAQYEWDLTDPGFMRLATYTSNIALDEHTLITGASPREARHSADEIEMKAHTFDWWIPVKSPYSLSEPFSVTQMRLHALGQSGLGIVPKLNLSPATMRPPFYQEANTGKSQSLLISDYVPEILWKTGAQDWDGEHREVKEVNVRIKYSLDWHGDQLNLTIKNDPLDRNYVVYLVIEEMMPGTGQVLHTAVPVPVNGQLTYVPQKFFDDEREAYRRVEGVINDFNRRYSEMVEVGPLDPVIGWVQPGNLASITGLERIIALAEEHQPELLGQVMAAHESKELFMEEF